MTMLLQEAYSDVSFLQYITTTIGTSMIIEPTIPTMDDQGDDGNITNSTIPDPPDGELN